MNPFRQEQLLPWLVALVLLLCSTSGTPAQQQLSLITFTNAWRYDQSGTDMGTGWQGTNFDDSAWPSGLPMFGLENSSPSPYASAGFNGMTTPLSLVAPGKSAETITYYFRTHFDFPITNFAGVELTATAYVDDGCVIYLNGTEAARLRVPSGQTWQTTSGGPPVEGMTEILNLPISSLRAGDNVLAVEVHQIFSSGNSDVAFALKLNAGLPLPIRITNQPQSLTAIAGTLASFSVGVSGTPVSFQWRTNGVNIPGATRASYTNVQLQAASAGVYSVVVSNVLGMVQSDDAVLTVLADTFGPRVLAANVLEESTATNRIQLVFSETLTLSDVHAPLYPAVLTNGTWRVTLANSNVTVPVSSSTYSPGNYPLPGTVPSVFLRVGASNWHIGSNYIITLNRLHDRVGNIIAPDTRIAVSWPQHQPLVTANAAWDFHAAAVFDPDVYAQDWTSPDYVPGPWWAQGGGPFCAGPALFTPCLGAPQTEVGFQPEPVLFRTPFVWSAPTRESTLQIAYNANDGVVFYLNGAELFRYNAPTNVGSVSALSRSPNAVASIACLTNILAVTNLVPGTNWIAAALLSSASGIDGTSEFGCSVQATWFEAPALPLEASSTLRLEPAATNTVVMSWIGSGFTLETTTNLPAPQGSWREVTNMSNPFTNALNTSQRFFRLRQ